MTVKVGVGVIIVNAAGQILLGKRCGSHAPYWSIPGGHVEQGETFEQTAIREVAEECGLHIDTPRFVGVTNNLRTWRDEGVHNVSIIMQVSAPAAAAPQRCEPDKCERWQWCDPRQLPQPCFDACQQGVQLWLTQQAYCATPA
ncbi:MULTISPECIES: nucleotide triphosphate diphosphatase NUDT15 [Edwardsiella]|uniref:ADP-ribose pyrophosphatase n=2 Tax=Edwardsiella anguillarum TaxID=1821960 RepID=A0A076LJN9_9GAMM|nr:MULTISPECIES: NUDIX domain-containing protein [Edwardsiella]AKM47418.1 ADP-ribose pyrophosphatase [Edwardsiella sp. EA181011]GAJ66092.1 hydrolase, NUDIX family [Edwardsiella piscicida]AIJ06803.1 ADP-ribose pyrophosphatase [Edwardsiella anguillarum ET080813]AKR78268.1 NUDIX domain-containing protein [Edwardsiella sp. LADL05-105]KAB0593401.1 NUDIX domain-containing protein [Edwardsiella anguillarum]